MCPAAPLCHLSAAALVLLHEYLPLEDIGSAACLCSGFEVFQKESWLLWRRLLEREAPEDAKRLVQKAQDKQTPAVWRGALKGHLKGRSQARRKYGSAALQEALRRLAAAHVDAPLHLAGGAGPPSGEKGGGLERGPRPGPLLPPAAACAARLEAAWSEGGREAPEVLVRSDARRLLRDGVRWHGKWDAPRSVPDLLAVACAPPAAVDSILEAAGGGFSRSAVVSGLFEALRCHRHHLLRRLLEAVGGLPADPRLMAIACYAKNAPGLQVLLDRNADPNAPCPRNCLAFPLDAVAARMAVPGETHPRPLSLAVAGRSWLPAVHWAQAPRLVSQLLAAGASVADGAALRSLLGQGGGAANAVSSRPWLDAFAAIAQAGGCPPTEPWLHIAAEPDHVEALLGSGRLPADAATRRDADGASAAALLALRALASGDPRWRAVLSRLLAGPGGEAAVTEVIDVARMQCSLPWLPLDEVWPCPVLGAALQWGDGALIRRCLTQAALDAYTAWKCRVMDAGLGWTALEHSSLVYRIARSGAAVLEAALREGLRFSRADTLRCHDGTETRLGPVASLALAAAEAEDPDEPAAFGRLAVLMLECGMDDPDALVCQNGVPGGFGALEALAAPAGYLNGLTESWLGPVRGWLVGRRCGQHQQWVEDRTGGADPL